MPALIQWHDPDETILRVTFEGRWTIEDFVEAVDNVQAQIDQKVPQPVSIILDMAKSGGIPRGATAIPQFSSAIRRLKYQYLLIAGGTSFGLTLSKIVIQLLPEKSRTIFFEQDVAAAEAHITSLRASAR